MITTNQPINMAISDRQLAWIDLHAAKLIRGRISEHQAQQKEEGDKHNSYRAGLICGYECALDILEHIRRFHEACSDNELDTMLAHLAAEYGDATDLREEAHVTTSKPNIHE